ncbi:MAG: NfeD family protein [Bacteroidetes bacterium]|uniref:NfeD family protein n=1 Tax=Candidatus Merdivivens pullicola TaxID=2840872 RepID=A0A9D9NHH1_9BACT|nr:NfeD family protein [Candidatus Merdivivens pullicola]
MEVWHIWAIIALVLVIIEIFTPGFAVLCLAFGAVAAAVASACSATFAWQLIWFSIVTLAAFVLVRPFLLKTFKRSKGGRESGINALAGRQATVTERISSVDNTGRAAIDGDDWKAVSVNGDDIEKGEKVIIESVESVILRVRKM